MSGKLNVDPYLTGGDAPPGARLSPCAACSEKGVGTWWPSYPNCWKCHQVGTRFFDEKPEPRPRQPPRRTATAAPSMEASSTAPVIGELVERPDALVPALPAPMAFPKPKRTQLQKHMEVIARQDRRLRKESAEIVLDSFATFDLPEDGSKPEGWSERKFRTAKLARLPDKDAPAALRHAARILESYRRSEALEDRKPSPTLNCDIQVFVRAEVNQTYNYEVQEVKGDE